MISLDKSISQIPFPAAGTSNWILLDASTSSSITPIQIQSISRTDLKSNDDERLQTINRLNDKVHKGILDSYKNPRRPDDENLESRKVVEDSFRFIDAENSGVKHKRERVITQRDEEGELEAVYEIRGDKRLSDESRKGRDPWKSQRIKGSPYGRETIQPSEPEPIYAMTRIGPPVDDASPPRRRYRRADSLDSGSMRLLRRPAPSQSILRPSASTAYSQPNLSTVSHNPEYERLVGT
ncbi:hypothetical protein WR25_23249 isoform B [Diploscapter pachys]|uniref:Uncharacterized protein n=1 Tax=Diploscapter pachys TaxID=2018661 RepID=A0A2A2JHV7_9BILA|nr:hypothetical protein WR25_23249 isoform B [Diploscapter pachys]